MGGRDHACEVCGKGGLDSALVGECECDTPERCGGSGRAIRRSTVPQTEEHPHFTEREEGDARDPRGNLGGSTPHVTEGGGGLDAAATLYRTIVADPPWPIVWVGTKGGRRARAVPLAYQRMSVEEICALRLPVDDDAHLYPWTTDEFLMNGSAAQVARAWGFEPIKHVLIWKKRNFGMGKFPRPQHEPCLIARRGSLPFARNDVGSVHEWPTPYAPNHGGKIHSAKPDASIDLFESASPGPYLELFARRARFGWDYWGDESLQTVELPPNAA